eukprot:2139689-Amphidinium_carterae.1
MGSPTSWDPWEDTHIAQLTSTHLQCSFGFERPSKAMPADHAVTLREELGCHVQQKSTNYSQNINNYEQTVNKQLTVLCEAIARC